MIDSMRAEVRQLQIDHDSWHVARGHMLLAARLEETLIVCLNDDTQGVGGLLHLRLAAEGAKSLDLSDNTLSLNLLLIERFMKELRSAGARAPALRGTLVAHIPQDSPLEIPASTLIGLIAAYFADAKIPLLRREIRHVPAVAVLFEPREGRLFLSGEKRPEQAVQVESRH
jgi:chemotaxis receptor (MCP) glutamine deamidase CheD